MPRVSRVGSQVIHRFTEHATLLFSASIAPLHLTLASCAQRGKISRNEPSLRGKNLFRRLNISCATTVAIFIRSIREQNRKPG